MWQEIITYLIILAAISWFGIRLFRKSQKIAKRKLEIKDPEKSGCEACGLKEACSKPPSKAKPSKHANSSETQSLC